VELTCPSEERIAVAHAEKAAKYEVLREAAAGQGWTLKVWPIEVGCRGFVGLSTMKVIRAFRFPRSKQSLIKQQLECVTRRASYFIWCCRDQVVWDSSRPLLPAVGVVQNHRVADV